MVKNISSLFFERVYESHCIWIFLIQYYTYELSHGELNHYIISHITTHGHFFHITTHGHFFRALASL